MNPHKIRHIEIAAVAMAASFFYGSKSGLMDLLKIGVTVGLFDYGITHYLNQENQTIIRMPKTLEELTGALPTPPSTLSQQDAVFSKKKALLMLDDQVDPEFKSFIKNYKVEV